MSGSATVTGTWDGADPIPGMIYQFRAWSFRESTMDPPVRSYISATEDLKGVFLYQP
ncbi:MAG: hypothetical protein GWO22_23065 [Actinobacteria bacterium]|nr:hypothetical protein [Actinomycetota bacterium]